jgi:hypothetical protein
VTETAPSEVIRFLNSDPEWYVLLRRPANPRPQVSSGPYLSHAQAILAMQHLEEHWPDLEFTIADIRFPPSEPGGQR